MEFIEITDEEALNLPADQLMAIAIHNYLLSMQPDYVPEDINLSPEEIDNQYQKLMQQIKG